MIYIAGDKHGYATIKIVEEYLNEHEIAFNNLGIKEKAGDIALEIMIPAVTRNVLKDIKNQGILSCGTGVGVEVGANKFAGIRACLAADEKTAAWAREFDDCNIICLIGWEPNCEKICRILDAWFAAKYDGDKKRLKMMGIFNTWH
jgi:ribose 5-phosphate isomerase B